LFDFRFFVSGSKGIKMCEPIFEGSNSGTMNANKISMNLLTLLS
jgi:hypothetical protein